MCIRDRQNTVRRVIAHLGKPKLGEGKEQPQRLELFCETIPEMLVLEQDA